MAKRTKIASLPGFAVYFDSEAKENEKYLLYRLWHDNHPEYGYLRKRRTIIGKFATLHTALRFAVDIMERAENKATISGTTPGSYLGEEY
jgi:hypothetical protein